MARAWIVKGKGSKEYGPYGLPELQRLAQSNKIFPTTQIKEEGSRQWVPARAVPYIFLNEEIEQSTKLIDMYRRDYYEALLRMDHKAHKLVASGKELRGLALFLDCMNTVKSVYEGVQSFYSVFFRNQNVLKRFGSQRLNRIEHELIPTFQIVKESSGYDTSDQDIENQVMRQLRKRGYAQKHWYIRERIFSEIGYQPDPRANIRLEDRYLW